MMPRQEDWSRRTISWYRGTPFGKATEEEGRNRQETGRGKAERARRICDADDEWFVQAVRKCSVMMSRMTTKHLEHCHNRTVPDKEDGLLELERKIAKAFKETTPVNTVMTELEREQERVRKMERKS